MTDNESHFEDRPAGLLGMMTNGEYDDARRDSREQEVGRESIIGHMAWCEFADPDIGLPCNCPYGTGAKDAEARIVAWMREQYADRFSTYDGERYVIAERIGFGKAADGIENGDHRA